MEPSVIKLFTNYGFVDGEPVFKGKQDVELLAHTYALKGPKNLDVSGAVAMFNKNPFVEYAEYDYLDYFTQLPDDSRFPEQWTLDNIGQTGGTPDSDIDAPEAWNSGTGDIETVTAVIDTGVDYYHEDLADNMWVNEDERPGNEEDDDGNGYINDYRGWDFYGDDNNPMDSNGHGTKVTGIISAITNNGIGVAGICRRCRIMPLRISSGVSLTHSDAAAAVVYAVDNGARIISNSWGGSDSATKRNAFQYAEDNGVLSIAAAGNDNSDNPWYPAYYGMTISVGATDDRDNKRSFSNYGGRVDVAAPGGDILSTGLNNVYGTLGGTSSATPHVSGIAGLVWSRRPDFTHTEIKGILRTAVDDLSIGQTGNKYIGTGRVNADKALQSDYVPETKLDNQLDDKRVNSPFTLQIKGTSRGDGFLDYTVDAGEGAYPTEWKTVKVSTTSVNNGVLAVWEGALCIPGPYSIRLRTKHVSWQVIQDRTIIYNTPGDGEVWCDNKDDDCDGTVDEGLSRKCGTNTGECSYGVSSCSGGKWGQCEDEKGPEPEVCDNKDNDCNGEIDDESGCGGKIWGPIWQPWMDLIS